MKLEPIFTVRENSLCFLDGTVCPSAPYPHVLAADFIGGTVPENSVFALDVTWAQVGLSEDSYDEAFLASLRDALKVLEEKRIFAVIAPVVSPVPASTEEWEALTASFKHCARRIKDCASVAGFALPAGADTELFTQELSQKHKQYVFFSGDNAVLSDKGIARL